MCCRAASPYEASASSRIIAICAAPAGTPLSRMDDLSTAVLVINAFGEIQMANKRSHTMFGYKKGATRHRPAAATDPPPIRHRSATDLLPQRSGQRGRTLDLRW